MKPFPSRVFRAVPALALALALAGPAAPLAQGADPAINRPFADPDVEKWVERFERPGREVYDRREQIAVATGVRRGMAVGDIGAGTGLFTRLFAPAVGPEGRVYAVDVAEPFVRAIRRTARERGWANVVGIVNTQGDTLLPPASIDLAFLADTYHHLERPLEILASIHRALRSRGKLVVVDFRREPGKSSAWVLEHVRAGEEEVIREIESAGFKLLARRDFLRENYFLEFGRSG